MLQDAKTRSAEQMLNTLQKLCGFIPTFKLPPMSDPGNDGIGHKMWLCVSQTNLFDYHCIQICTFVTVIINVRINMHKF